MQQILINEISRKKSTISNVYYTSQNICFIIFKNLKPRNSLRHYMIKDKKYDNVCQVIFLNVKKYISNLIFHL